MRTRLSTWYIGLAGIIGFVLLAGCGQSPEPAKTYEPLAIDDIELNFQLTEQNYFVVWNVGWVVNPVIDNENLEPNTGWIVSYETTAPSAPLFVGETYSFEVHIDQNGDPTFSGDGLRVASHGINAHPDRLEVEVSSVVKDPSNA